MIVIIIPAYNSEKTISGCIESVLKQNVEKEIIVVDNNSTDNTKEIVRRYPVKYLFESKKGPAAARNRGLKEIEKMGIKPKYVAFIDSDVILPNNDWIKRAINILEDNKIIAGVGGPGKSFNKNIISEVFDYLLYGNISTKENKFVNSLATMDVVYKYNYIKGIFFNEDLIAAAVEDVDFNFYLIKKGYKLIYSENLWVYHHNPTKIKEVVKKWFNYGKYYPFPYFWHKRLFEVGLWGRIIYLPAVLICFFIGLIFKNFMFFYLSLLLLPLFYLIIGLRVKIKNPIKLLVFLGIHTIKQWAQILGIWVGIIQRTLKCKFLL